MRCEPASRSSQAGTSGSARTAWRGRDDARGTAGGRTPQRWRPPSGRSVRVRVCPDGSTWWGVARAGGVVGKNGLSAATWASLIIWMAWSARSALSGQPSSGVAAGRRRVVLHQVGNHWLVSPPHEPVEPLRAAQGHVRYGYAGRRGRAEVPTAACCARRRAGWRAERLIGPGHAVVAESHRQLDQCAHPTACGCAR
jgi:hypothetical protein